MNSSSTESEPLRQQLMPQTSIRFFLLLIGTSALVMLVFRAAIVGAALWAKIAALLITVAGSCFLAYAGVFLVANLFSATASPLLNSLTPRGGADSPSNGDSAGEP